MHKKVFIGIVFTLFLSACAGMSQPSREITVEATDFAYSPLSITIPADQPVMLTFKNIGKVEHDFVINQIDVTGVEAKESVPSDHHHDMNQPNYDLHFSAQSGENSVWQFTALEPGTYEIYCSVEGHRAAGMIGKLIVAAPE